MILTYINPLNKNYKGEYTYEFLFSEDTDIDLGDDWDVQPASSGVVTPPPVNSIIGVGALKTEHLEFDLALSSDNFLMYDCLEKIIALGWEKETPENDERLVFHFGEESESVLSKLYARDINLEIKKTK